jgi:hypothetical protein
VPLAKNQMPSISIKQGWPQVSAFGAVVSCEL